MEAPRPQAPPASPKTRWKLPPGGSLLLESVYSVQPCPSLPTRASLAEQLKATTRQVTVWFQSESALREGDTHSTGPPTPRPHCADKRSRDVNIHKPDKQKLPSPRLPGPETARKPSSADKWAGAGDSTSGGPQPWVAAGRSTAAVQRPGPDVLCTPQAVVQALVETAPPPAALFRAAGGGSFGRAAAMAPALVAPNAVPVPWQSSRASLMAVMALEQQLGGAPLDLATALKAACGAGGEGGAAGAAVTMGAAGGSRGRLEIPRLEPPPPGEQDLYRTASLKAISSPALPFHALPPLACCRLLAPHRWLAAPLPPARHQPRLRPHLPPGAGARQPVRRVDPQLDLARLAAGRRRAGAPTPAVCLG